MRVHRTAVVLACGLVAAARADDRAVKDALALQGEWQATGLTADGRKAADAEARMFRITVAGDRLTLGAGGEDRKAMFRLDPATTPRSIDLTWLDGAGKGTTVPGIYALEAGRWRLCVPNPKAGEPRGRPSEFTAAAGEGRMLFTLDRVKPE